jgi:hypothetical protein
MVKHATQLRKRHSETAAARAGQPDPALVSIVEYLAEWAANRDYEEHRKNMETAGAAAAPREQDS